MKVHGEWKISAQHFFWSWYWTYFFWWSFLGFVIGNYHQQSLYYPQIRILIVTLGLLVNYQESKPWLPNGMSPCFPLGDSSSYGFEMDWRAGSEQHPGARLEKLSLAELGTKGSKQNSWWSAIYIPTACISWNYQMTCCTWKKKVNGNI